MGGTLIRLVDQGHDVHVCYQTSGNIAGTTLTHTHSHSPSRTHSYPPLSSHLFLPVSLGRLCETVFSFCFGVCQNVWTASRNYREDISHRIHRWGIHRAQATCTGTPHHTTPHHTTPIPHYTTSTFSLPPLVIPKREFNTYQNNVGRYPRDPKDQGVDSSDRSEGGSALCRGAPQKHPQSPSAVLRNRQSEEESSIPRRRSSREGAPRWSQTPPDLLRWRSLRSSW